MLRTTGWKRLKYYAKQTYPRKHIIQKGNWNYHDKKYAEKTYIHGHCYEWEGRRINIIRNPRDALISWTRWAEKMYDFRDRRYTPENILKHGVEEFGPFVKAYGLMLDYIRGEPFIRYEDPDKTVLEDYLDVKIGDDWYGRGKTWNLGTNWEEHWPQDLEMLWQECGGLSLDHRVRTFDSPEPAVHLQQKEPPS